MKKRHQYYWTVAGILLASVCLSASAAISISGVGTHANPSGGNDGLSGICYAGGTQYYAVDDSGGLMQPATIIVNLNSGAITSAFFSPAVTLGGADLESIDYNAANNSVFVSDETGATIKEYGLAATNYLSSVAVPSIFASYRPNFSLESLTIRGNGLEMWTCNEEALYDTSPVVDDGPLSTASNGSVVRLQRFTRSSVHDTWITNGQWAYLTESFGADSDLTTGERSGVSDLCVLPDGTLLVLERTLGYSTFIPHFENRIYEIDFTGATDVSAISSLNGATYTRVTKTQRWSGSFSTTYNFEGLCLGPRLNDGSLSMLMVADGDGDQDNGLYSLKLSGLATRDLTVLSAYGIADPAGGPYRYMSGTTVTNSVAGSPFLQGGYRYECTGWTTAGHTPSSGSGTNAILTLGNDVQLTWNWTQVPNSSNTLNYAQTFESYPDGFQMPGTNGWMAASLMNAVVTTNAALVSSLANYSQACGYPAPSAGHAKVLEVNGTVTNYFDMPTNQVVWADYMARPVHGPLPFDTNLLAGVQAAVGFNMDDHPAVWHYDLAGGTNRWAVINDVTVSTGDWVRLTFMFDYQTDDPIKNVRYFQVRVDGNLLANAQAWTSNDGTGSLGGSWFAMSSEPDYFTWFSSKSGSCTAMDDLVVTTNNPLAREVVVVSVHGQTDPAVGNYSHTYGDAVTLSLTNSMLEQGTNQFLYNGWEMAGHAPASGSGTNVQITLTNDLVLTWLWTTNNAQTAQGTPIWWLESHGLNVDDDLLDGDNDGLLSWQEWVGDTLPTDSNSVLRITDIQVDGAGADVFWQGGVQATQVLERRTNLVSGTDWMPLLTNLPPTSVTNSYSDSAATNNAEFYRIKVWR